MPLERTPPAVFGRRRGCPARLGGWWGWRGIGRQRRQRVVGPVLWGWSDRVFHRETDAGLLLGPLELHDRRVKGVPLRPGDFLAFDRATAFADGTQDILNGPALPWLTGGGGMDAFFPHSREPYRLAQAESLPSPTTRSAASPRAENFAP
jgi:hypothetical protein